MSPRPSRFGVLLPVLLCFCAPAPGQTVFDRWPYDIQARRYDLPMGPIVGAPRKRIEYLWSIGVSFASASTLLYIAVEVPANAVPTGSFPHQIYITGPPSSPMHTMERGITYLQGPAAPVLASGQEPVSCVVDQADPAFGTNVLPAVSLPGDLVRNCTFRRGLLDLQGQDFAALSEAGGIVGDSSRTCDFWLPASTASSRIAHSCRSVMPAVMTYLATDETFENQVTGNLLHDRVSRIQ